MAEPKMTSLLYGKNPEKLFPPVELEFESILEKDDALIFKLLPDALEINPQDLTRRYAALKRFMRAA